VQRRPLLVAVRPRLARGPRRRRHAELGCPGDWQPDCAATFLAYDDEDTVWQGAFSIPAGDWEYKAALNGSWDENYGAERHAQRREHPAVPGGPETVKFYYDHATHWITDDVGSTIATAPGSFQSELGCAGDWDPSCLRSWLQDPDGDGILQLPHPRAAGRQLRGQGRDRRELGRVNYGAGGVQNGPNIPFTVASDCAETSSSTTATHVLTVGPAPRPAQPSSVTIPGSFQTRWAAPATGSPTARRRNSPSTPTTRLAGDLRDPGRLLGVQGGARRLVGRELRRQRHPQRAQHRVDPGFAVRR
jgi:hypothetical protein